MINWDAYAAHITACGRDIDSLRTELALLEVGSSGVCGPETNYVWTNTTGREKGRARRAIALRTADMRGF